MSKGTYVLRIKVKKDLLLNVGALGKRRFEKGVYLYVGSAMNSLEKRVKRHIKKEKKKRWHIDYLTTVEDVEIEGAYVFREKRIEEKLSEALSEICKSVDGFGASDMKNVKSNLYLSNEDAKKVIQDWGGSEFDEIFSGDA